MTIASTPGRSEDAVTANPQSIYRSIGWAVAIATVSFVVASEATGRRFLNPGSMWSASRTHRANHGGYQDFRRRHPRAVKRRRRPLAICNIRAVKVGASEQPQYGNIPAAKVPHRRATRSTATFRVARARLPRPAMLRFGQINSGYQDIPKTPRDASAHQIRVDTRTSPNRPERAVQSTGYQTSKRPAAKRSGRCQTHEPIRVIDPRGPRSLRGNPASWVRKSGQAECRTTPPKTPAAKTDQAGVKPTNQYDSLIPAARESLIGAIRLRWSGRSGQAECRNHVAEYLQRVAADTT